MASSRVRSDLVFLGGRNEFFWAVENIIFLGGRNDFFFVFSGARNHFWGVLGSRKECIF